MHPNPADIGILAAILWLVLAAYLYPCVHFQEPKQPRLTSSPHHFATTPTMSIRKLTVEDFEPAVKCITHCFESDQVDQYLSHCDGRSEAEARKLDEEIFGYIIYAHLMNGLVITIGDFEGIACWMPPGKNMDDWWTILRSGMWRLNFRFGAEGRARYFNEFLPLLNETKSRVLGAERDQNSWYLVYLGTLPSARGKGYSRKLVEYVTAMADADFLYCYLESSAFENRAIYERFGFTYKDTIHLKRGQEPIPLEIMVREPNPIMPDLTQRKPTSKADSPKLSVQHVEDMEEQPSMATAAKI